MNDRYRPSGRERVGLAARNIAARMLESVIEDGNSLDRITDEHSGFAGFRALIAKDRALVLAIVTTALRRRGHIDCALRKCMDRPPPKKATHLSAIMHVAAAQVLFMEVPDSAAVNLAITGLGEDRRSRRFTGFGNAVLRRLAREKTNLLADCTDWRLAFPPWLAKRIQTDFGRDRAGLIADAVLGGAPLDLSLSPRLGIAERKSLVAALDGSELANGTVRIFHQTPVRNLPGYAEGAWWVQDYAASLPARMLGSVEGLAVADLCAAPGGKTAQLAAAGADVTAVDQSKARLARVTENMARLGLPAKVTLADIEQWQPGRKFDAVLLDVPCSATGTLRRHPDAGWIRNNEMVANLAELQKRLLRRAIALTSPGGRVVYSNCSLLKQEGEDIAAGFAAMSGIVPDPLLAGEIDGTDGLINGQGALRTLPCDQPGIAHSGGMDGFFAIRFKVTG